MADDLHLLKDDMHAFIVGHGLGRFHAYIGEDMNSVLWDSSGDPDSWKDFIELNKEMAPNLPVITEKKEPLAGHE